MSKLTAKQIEERCERTMVVYQRALQRGDITQQQFDDGLRDLARWSVEKISQLPQAQAVEQVMSLLLGERK
jgi:hypothetical protein